VMSDIEGTAGWSAAPFVSTFPSEDARALARELERLLDAPAGQRTAEGVGNRAWVHAHMSVEAWSEQICAIYRSLL
jgi:hypothetical protein